MPIFPGITDHVSSHLFELSSSVQVLVISSPGYTISPISYDFRDTAQNPVSFSFFLVKMLSNSPHLSPVQLKKHNPLEHTLRLYLLKINLRITRFRSPMIKARNMMPMTHFLSAISYHILKNTGLREGLKSRPCSLDFPVWRCSLEGSWGRGDL